MFLFINKTISTSNNSLLFILKYLSNKKNCFLLTYIFCIEMIPLVYIYYDQQI